MRNILKIIGRIGAVVIALILFFVALFFGSIKWNKYSKRKDAARYQKEVCDTIKTVEGNFELKLDGFTKKELSSIHFYLQQDKLLVRDTLIGFVPKDNNETQKINLPFDKFNIDDKLIVSVGKRYFVLSNYSYAARYNYGMFGPVGNCECEANGFETLNGKPVGSGWLIKKYGWLDYQLSLK